MKSLHSNGDAFGFEMVVASPDGLEWAKDFYLHILGRLAGSTRQHG